MSVHALYEPLIERDLDAIPAAARTFAAEHGSDELFKAVARFAILAYAPSQHAKHAVLACLAVHELRDGLGARFDDALIECAIYTASSRQPWSEPPILDPPALDDAQRGDAAEVLAAIGEGDRLRAERWLAKTMHGADFPREFFRVAATDFEDLGHKLIVATAAWKLAALLGDKGKYAALRIAVWEWTAYRGRAYGEQGIALDPETLFARLADNLFCAAGSIVCTHALFLLDAALEASSLANNPRVATRVRDYLTNYTNATDATIAPPLDRAPDEVPVYRFARDYAGCLKMYAMTKRLAARWPDLPLQKMRDTAWHNLEHGEAYSDIG